MPGVELSDRESTILKAVIEGHIGSAKPVSSSAVVRLSSVSLSSATVRSVMRALEEKGLILQPHTSAGRVPTVQGYRFFVNTLLTIQPLDRLQIDRAQAFAEIADISGLLGVSNRFSVSASYDLDGDGFITREEWLGSDAVFDALDEDHDGKISPAEMGTGLGGILQLAGSSS